MFVRSAFYLLKIQMCVLFILLVFVCAGFKMVWRFFFVFCSFQIYMMERLMMQIQMECDLVSCYLWLGMIVIGFETFSVLRYFECVSCKIYFLPLFFC